MVRRAGLSSLGKGVAGIFVEILGTLALMAFVFIIGFLILKWFSRI
ncbi:MAG: hypothetical protein PHO42_06350 [Candidatus Omnitrophica bacterium]|nr:hypothetical protein [Candidatus Omnitrophota bacterium]